MSKELYITAVGHRVLVKPDPVETKSSGGIILAINEKLHEAGQVIGTLVSTGDQAWKAFENGIPWARVGDRVYFAKYAGKEVYDPVTEEKYFIMNDEDILGIVHDSGQEDK